MSNIKTVPNQKVVKVNKQPCGNGNLYAAINLGAMEQAAAALDGNCFKLWVYFAKNQNGYEFALSSKAIADTFGIKKTAYDRAVKELIEKGYLVQLQGNKYAFNEIPVVLNQYKALYQNNTTALYENNTRNNTINNTIDNTLLGGGDGYAATLPIQEAAAIEVTIQPPTRAAKPVQKQDKKELWRF